MPVIYADILLIINLAVDYLVLFGTARLAGIKYERLKGLLAALAGAAYSFIILFDIPNSLFISTKLIISCVMVLISFGKRKVTDFIRILIIFYVCSFIFSGFMMLINSVVHADSFFVKNGIVYFEFSAVGIVISGTAAFFVTEVLRRLFRHGEPEGCSMVKIYFKDRNVVLKGFTDTGNNLAEPFSGTPVAVANIESLKCILPENMEESIENEDLSIEYGIKLIPAKTVSGTVLMPAFKPEKVEVKNENGEFIIEEIMIAVSEYAPENTLIMGKNIALKEKNKIFSEV